MRVHQCPPHCLCPIYQQLAGVIHGNEFRVMAVTRLTNLNDTECHVHAKLINRSVYAHCPINNKTRKGTHSPINSNELKPSEHSINQHCRSDGVHTHLGKKTGMYDSMNTHTLSAALWKASQTTPTRRPSPSVHSHVACCAISLLSSCALTLSL